MSPETAYRLTGTQGTIVSGVLTGYVRCDFTEEQSGVRLENWHGICMGPFLLDPLCMRIVAIPFKKSRSARSLMGLVPARRGGPS
ncbi:MAG: hypothetical protein ACLP7Q_17140 [Isosphaeraceae bacterium]